MRGVLRMLVCVNIRYSQVVGLFWYLGKFPIPKHNVSISVFNIVAV